MTKDTSRTEQALSHISEARKLVRQDYADGLNVDKVHQDITDCEDFYRRRLADLKDWNARQPKPEAVQLKEEPKAEAKPESKSPKSK